MHSSYCPIRSMRWFKGTKRNYRHPMREKDKLTIMKRIRKHKVDKELRRNNPKQCM